MQIKKFFQWILNNWYWNLKLSEQDYYDFSSKGIKKVTSQVLWTELSPFKIHKLKT